MYLVQYVSFTWLLVKLVQCRDLWSTSLPQGPDVVLEKGKPIQLPKNFTKVQLCNLKGTLYSDSLSQLQGVTELGICQIYSLRKIEKGALCAASSIKVLDIDFYGNTELPVLKKETFENCENLEELLLKFDSVAPAPLIENDALENVPNLKNLQIQNLKISHLKKNFLKIQNDSLKELVLSFANVEKIDEDVFDDFRHLEVLYIIHNLKLSRLPRKPFKNLKNLKKLVLRDNALQNLTWDEFEGLSSLKELNLVDNLISSLDAEKIAYNLPNLEKFQFEINPLLCRDIEEFVNKLKETLKHQVELSYKSYFGYNSCE